MTRIVETRRLTPVTKLFRLDAPLIAMSARAGQFVMLRVREGGERIPVTIADYDRAAGAITIVVQDVGATTKRVCALEAGDEILDVVGPLGVPVEIAPGGHVCGVGGGFGSAALLCLMKELAARGDTTTAIVGARTADLLILTDELRAICTNLEICTDDGSAGIKGFVTQRLAQLIAGEGPGRPDTVVAIGPMVMLRAIAETTREPNVRTLVSLDPLMVDGTGMCGGCRVIVGGQTRFACVDGPIFDGHQVDCASGMRRSKQYVRQEKVALERLACAATPERAEVR
ncbi:MAG TPA: sulfide/dihydroorotate dehydrogenase-like FAD/NAD-binding protein [Patescibacteria group bacterium]|nr:sulfide/dihydroorotate dehydrogenase-like FAD/NAD-binding protein [Patescibacteria group bacterium]